MSTLLVVLDDERDVEHILDENYPADIGGTILFRDGDRFLSWFKRMYDSGTLSFATTLFSFDHYINTYRNGIELTGYDVVKEMVDHILTHPGLRGRINHFAHTSNYTARCKIDMLFYKYNAYIEEQQLTPSKNGTVVNVEIKKRVKK